MDSFFEGRIKVYIGFANVKYSRVKIRNNIKMITLSKSQEAIFTKLTVDISLSKFSEISDKSVDFLSLSADEQLDFLKITNAFYRSGEPLINDAEYDALLTVFAKDNPEHPYLLTVESVLYHLL